MFLFDMKSIRVITAAALIAAACLLARSYLQAGSRLGKVNGVMGTVISVNLGTIHGVRQGLRGKVFEFDEDKNTIDVVLADTTSDELAVLGAEI